MFYLTELAALAIVWFFFAELHWLVARKVRKACSGEYLRRRLLTLSDRMFFAPVSGKAQLGYLYYFHRISFWVLVGLSCFHLVLGWAAFLRGTIRLLTTVAMLAYGAVGASCSGDSTAYVCVNRGIKDKRAVLVLQILSFASELLLIAAYLYFAWIWIG